VRSEPVPVRVPPGTPDGSRLRVPDMGHTGRSGGRSGDLYVTVHVRPHPIFRRDGDRLFCVVPISIPEAVWGVPGPNGRGDLVIEVTLVLPETLDERSKALVREFGERNADDVRRNLKV
jgi:DnaJ-class molecular chaperone